MDLPVSDGQPIDEDNGEVLKPLEDLKAETCAQNIFENIRHEQKVALRPIVRAILQEMEPPYVPFDIANKIVCRISELFKGDMPTNSNSVAVYLSRMRIRPKPRKLKKSPKVDKDLLPGEVASVLQDAYITLKNIVYEILIRMEPKGTKKYPPRVLIPLVKSTLKLLQKEEEEILASDFTIISYVTKVRKIISDKDEVKSLYIGETANSVVKNLPNTDINLQSIVQRILDIVEPIGVKRVSGKVVVSIVQRIASLCPDKKIPTKEAYIGTCISKTRNSATVDVTREKCTQSVIDVTKEECANSVVQELLKTQVSLRSAVYQIVINLKGKKRETSVDQNKVEQILNRVSKLLRKNDASYLPQIDSEEVSTFMAEINRELYPPSLVEEKRMMKSYKDSTKNKKRGTPKPPPKPQPASSSNDEEVIVNKPVNNIIKAFQEAQMPTHKIKKRQIVIMAHQQHGFEDATIKQIAQTCETVAANLSIFADVKNWEKVVKRQLGAKKKVESVPAETDDKIEGLSIEEAEVLLEQKNNSNVESKLLTLDQSENSNQGNSYNYPTNDVSADKKWTDKQDYKDESGDEWGNPEIFNTSLGEIVLPAQRNLRTVMQAIFDALDPDDALTILEESVVKTLKEVDTHCNTYLAMQTTTMKAFFSQIRITIRMEAEKSSLAEEGQISEIDRDSYVGVPPEEDEFWFVDGDEGLENRDLTDATDAKPGSDDKILMLAARYAGGIPLYNENDKTNHTDTESREYEDIESLKYEDYELEEDEVDESVEPEADESLEPEKK